MSDQPIYLDHHATTPVDPRVLEAMLPFFSQSFGNAASFNHAYGREAAAAVKTARGEIAGLIGAAPREIIFTSGATEANNLAIKGVLRAAGVGSHLVTANVEHRAVLDPAKRLKRAGYDVTIVPVDEDGFVDPRRVEEALTLRTALVSIMTANNEIGTLQPIAEIGAICRARGVPFHTDAAQALGRVPLDLAGLPVDLMSLSAHKIYGPKGVGCLVARKGDRRVPIEPLIDGGGHEQHLRSGTLPVPLIVGFGAACRIASEEMARESERLGGLRDRLWKRLSVAVDGLLLNGSLTNRLPGNLNVSVEGVDGEALMERLTRVAVSSGSACTTADPEPSHVLRAIGRSDALCRASLRFGLGRFTTEQEIDVAADHVVDTILRLRTASMGDVHRGSDRPAS